MLPGQDPSSLAHTNENKRMDKRRTKKGRQSSLVDSRHAQQRLRAHKAAALQKRPAPATRCPSCVQVWE